MPAARPTIYLVDAMSNIHRAYHAIRGLSTKAGRPTNAVYGFVTMLKKMLREHPSEYLAVAFDRPEKTVRHEEYEGYKANRVAMDEDLASQIPEIRRACAAYRIPVLEMPGYEADDVIGTLSRSARAAGFDVVIVTADKDMLQLVEGARVRVFHTGKEKFLDDKGVEEFFGVAPGQVVDVLALMGDSSDNIPGVPRVGEVTAKKWIKEYGTLDQLLARAEEVKGKVGESLREHTRRRAALAAPGRDQDRPAHPVRHRGVEALGARSREIEGALRRARVPLPRGRDPGRGRPGGALLQPPREGQRRSTSRPETGPASRS